MRKPFSAISLFSGAGGMDIGFQEAGFEVQWANDFDFAACQTYAENLGAHIQHGPIQEYIESLHRYSGVDLVFGGPPCQGFSVAGKMDPNDARSDLLWSFFDVIEAVRPVAFVCENVKALAKLEKFRRVRRRLFERVQELGYTYELVVLNAKDFGVSQSRERMFLIGTRSEADVTKIPTLFEGYKEKPKSLRALFSDLGPAGSPRNARVCPAKITMAASPVMRRSPYAGMLFNGQGRPLNPDGVSSTLHASMGGNKTPIIDELHLHFDEPSWIEQYHSELLAGADPLPFEAAPARLRRLTVDEAIRIQSFPDDYKFRGNKADVFRQVGNAVPCGLAQKVGSVVSDLLHGVDVPEKPQWELPLAAFSTSALG